MFTFSNVGRVAKTGDSLSHNELQDQAEKGLHGSQSNFCGTEGSPKDGKAASIAQNTYNSRSTTLNVQQTPENADDPESLTPVRVSWASKLFTLVVTIVNIFRVANTEAAPAPSETSDRSETADNDLSKGYERFSYRTFDQYPNGWPRTAAFLETSDTFGIYRRFGQCHARILVSRMASITEIEGKISKLDKSDEDGGKHTDWRLKNRFHDENQDTQKRDLFQQLEKEMLAYDELLLKYRQLKCLPTTSKKDHDSVFKWIWANQPLDDGEDEWIFHPGDFVSLVSPRRNQLESFLQDCLHRWPVSAFKTFFKAKTQHLPDRNTRVEFISTRRITIFAKLIVVFFAVLVLLTPVMLFWLTSMSRTSMAVVVLCFVFIFSLMMSVFTEAGVQEIFVGTSTYCAVLVTFLGNLQSAKS